MATSHRDLAGFHAFGLGLWHDDQSVERYVVSVRIPGTPFAECTGNSNTFDDPRSWFIEPAGYGLADLRPSHGPDQRVRMPDWDSQL